MTPVFVAVFVVVVVVVVVFLPLFLFRSVIFLRKCSSSKGENHGLLLSFNFRQQADFSEQPLGSW